MSPAMQFLISRNIQQSALPLFGNVSEDAVKNVNANFVDRLIDKERPCFNKHQVNNILLAEPIMHGLFFTVLQYTDTPREGKLTIYDVTGVAVKVVVIKGLLPLNTVSMASRKATEWEQEQAPYYVQNIYLAVKRAHIKALYKAAL